MKLILKKDKFDLKRVSFKDSKGSKKLLYNMDGLFMVGITLNIVYDSIKIRNSLIFIRINEEDIQLIEQIDNYLKTKYDPYESFIHNNNIIKIKKHDTFKQTEDSNNKITITINSIKNINQINKVQIFSI